MSNKKLFLFLALVAMLLTACIAILENGQLWYCHGKSLFDIVQEKETLVVRFTCLDEDDKGPFTLTFEGPDDGRLSNKLRKVSGTEWMGVVLDEGEIIQLFEQRGVGTYTIHWP